MNCIANMATFVSVVDSKGFAAAGRSLGMSASTVTEHIHALERRLGVRLLNRSTRSVSLTEVGNVYYQRSKQIIAAIKDADRVAQASNSLPRGTLRVNASIAIPPLIAPIIAKFAVLYPDVSLILNMTDSMIDIVKEGFDLAIRHQAVPDSSLIARRIATYRRVVSGAPGYFRRRGLPKTPADLVEHSCLIYSNSPDPGGWRFFGPDGDQTISLRGYLETNSTAALRLAAVQEQGLIMTPMFLVAEDIAAGRLIPVLQEYSDAEYEIHAIYPHREHMAGKVRSFIDLSIKHFRNDTTKANPRAMAISESDPIDPRHFGGVHLPSRVNEARLED
jgi:DNA-binding transcriptional LysR family regulator